MGDTPVPALGRANQVGLSLLLHRFHGRIGLGFAFFPVYDGQRNLPIFRPGANPHINIDVLVSRHYRPGNQRVETKRKSREHRDLWNSNGRSEEHTSELTSLMRNSYAVFCLK